MADAIVALTNAGTTPNLTIHQTAGDTLLATIALPDFTVSGAVATSAANTNSAEAVANGTAGYARVNSSDGTEIFRGAVGVGSGEVQISSTSITSGDTVTLTADVTWTAPL